MLKVVENAVAIRRFERQFLRSLKPHASATIPVRLGHPGASEQGKVVWSEGLQIWSFARKVEGLRYWHAFGIGRPAPGATVAITCEVNFPLCGIDRRTGGAFAADPEGRVFVVHRGKLGGARKGVGKSLFESRYRGVWEVIDDGDGQSTVAVIGSLASPRFSRQLAQFVHKIAQLKEEAIERSTQTEIAFDEPTLREVLIGDPFPAAVPEQSAGCDQGLVIRDLAAALAARGLKVGNSDLWDLAARDRSGSVLALFQVRCDTDLAGLLASAGRLLLEAPALPSARLCLVTPAPLAGDLADRLKAAGVEGLPYRWEGDKSVFPGLEAFLTGARC